MRAIIRGAGASAATILALGLRLAAAGGPQEAGRRTVDTAAFRPAPGDVAYVEGFPAIGKWMIGPDLSNASWLGAHYERKSLREPVNIVIVDALAKSAEDAVRRFLKACAAAGYESRPGHSGGYFGWLGGRLYPQIPSGKHHAISNEPFEFHNNHGRFFGPCLWEGRYYLTGALSREKMDPASRAKHDFVSFDQARDQFARALVEKAGFRITAFQCLDNALLDDPGVGTGDHDGIAIVLTATR